MIYSSFILLFFGFVCVIFNIILGLKLSWNSSETADFHLISAILILAFNFIGNICIIIATKRRLEKYALSNSGQNFQTLIQKRESCIRISLLVIGISVVSLLTGTTSQAGELPWIHAVLGVSLFGASIVSLYKWLRYSTH